MTIIFDFDGTLHNTKRLYGCAVRKVYDWLVEGGYANEHYYSDDDLSVYLGVNAPDMWKSFMPSLPEDIKNQASMMIGQEMIRRINAGEAVLYDGIPEALDTLRGMGLKLSVLSNCRTAYMDAHRNYFGLDKWFDNYYCAEAYGFIPKEKIFLSVKKESPGEAFIMVGDRASDFLVSKTHSIPFIGCSYGFGTAEELAGAGIIISSPDMLSGAVAGIIK